MDIKAKKETTILLEQEFSSFEELSYITNQWDIDFRQLSTEQFKPHIFQAQTGSILLSNAYFGCHVEQRGTTPHGMRTFAVLSTDCPELHWFGHIVNKDELLIFPTHGEVDCFTRTGFSVTTISIPEDLLAEFFEQNGINHLKKIMGPEEIVKKTSKNNLNKLRYLVSQIQQSARINAPHQAMGTPILTDTLQNQILLCIFDIMTDNYFQNKDHTYTLSRKITPQKLQLLIEYIKENNSELLQIKDLCHIAQISERSLQYLFKHRLDMTPKAYLKGQKLYNVHKKLWQSKPSEVEISTIAHHFGFWHMGQFAADYRKLFGELPSTTLKRSV